MDDATRLHPRLQRLAGEEILRGDPRTPAQQEYAGGVIYECGNTEVFMYPTSNAGASKASEAFWSVADVETEVAELKARGVKFDEHDVPGVTMENGIATGGGAKTAWFKDRSIG